jgi:hypothetical protein
VALLEKHRAKMFTEFSQLLGEETAQAMMAEFPARDRDEPATKADLDVLRAEVVGQLRVEISQVGDRLTNRMLTIAGLGLGAMTGLFAIFT